jgi:hypothetical protein
MRKINVKIRNRSRSLGRFGDDDKKGKVRGNTTTTADPYGMTTKGKGASKGRSLGDDNKNRRKATADHPPIAKDYH